MCCCTASHGMRRRAPISAGGSGIAPDSCFVKRLDEVRLAMYRHATLPLGTVVRRQAMAASTPADIRVGDMTIRYLGEGNQSGGAVAIFQFDVPTGAKFES